MQSPGGASGVSVSVCGALGRSISKVAAGGAVLSGSSCTAKLWNAEREREKDIAERERKKDVPIPSRAIKGPSRASMCNHAQSCAIKSKQEQSRAIQSNHLWKASRGIEAADSSEDQGLSITAPSARSSELGGDFGARRSVTRACISSRRAISRAAILCACTCRGNEGDNQHANTVRRSTIATSNREAISMQSP